MQCHAVNVEVLVTNPGSVRHFDHSFGIKNPFFSQKVCNRIADGEFEFELEIHLNSINQKHLVPSSRFLFLIETDSN